MGRGQYQVEVVSTVTRQFVIDANTPEEAESIAEQLHEDGEGEKTGETIECVEVLPVEEDAEAVAA